MLSSDSRSTSSAGSCSCDSRRAGSRPCRRPRCSPAVISVRPLNSLTAPRTCTRSPEATPTPLGAKMKMPSEVAALPSPRVLQVVAAELTGRLEVARDHALDVDRRSDDRRRRARALDRADRDGGRLAERHLTTSTSAFAAPGVFSASPSCGVPVKPGMPGEVEVVGTQSGGGVGVGAVGDPRGAAGRDVAERAVPARARCRRRSCRPARRRSTATASTSSTGEPGVELAVVLRVEVVADPPAKPRTRARTSLPFSRVPAASATRHRPSASAVRERDHLVDGADVRPAIALDLEHHGTPTGRRRPSRAARRTRRRGRPCPPRTR